MLATEIIKTKKKEKQFNTVELHATEESPVANKRPIQVLIK